MTLENINQDSINRMLWKLINDYNELSEQAAYSEQVGNKTITPVTKMLQKQKLNTIKHYINYAALLSNNEMDVIYSIDNHEIDIEGETSIIKYETVTININTSNDNKGVNKMTKETVSCERTVYGDIDGLQMVEEKDNGIVHTFWKYKGETITDLTKEPIVKYRPLLINDLWDGEEDIDMILDSQNINYYKCINGEMVCIVIDFRIQLFDNDDLSQTEIYPVDMMIV